MITELEDMLATTAGWEKVESIEELDDDAMIMVSLWHHHKLIKVSLMAMRC